MRIQGVENDVYLILKNHKDTRNDDMLLYWRYVGFASHWSVNFTDCFTSPKIRESHRIAGFETVSRCRRKLQRKYQELRATKEVEQARHKKEQEMFDYAVDN